MSYKANTAIYQTVLYHFYRYGVKQNLVAKFLNMSEPAVAYHFKKFRDSGYSKRQLVDPTPIEVLEAEGLTEDPNLKEIIDTCPA